MKPLNLLFFLLLCLVFVQVKAQNPFEEFGYKPKIATLSKGKYVEFIKNDTIVQVGNILYNTITDKIVGFVEKDTLNFPAGVASRWWSIDPLAEEYYSLTPYNYVANNPIIFIDPDGRKLDVSNIMQDKELREVFLWFAGTKIGQSYLGQYAQKGDKIGDFEFEEDGVYHKEGIDLTYKAEELGKDRENGSTKFKLINKGETSERLQITVTINKSLNSFSNDFAGGYKDALTDNYENGGEKRLGYLRNARLMYWFSRTETLTHESFIHSYMLTKNYLNGAKSRLELFSWANYRNERGHHSFILDSSNNYSNFKNSKFGSDGYNLLQEVAKTRLGISFAPSVLQQRMLNFDE